jgi:hypothetical protein
MKVSRGNLFIYFVIIGILIVALHSSASALTVRLNPNDVDRAPENKVRIFIWADDAVDLISMGVKVSFDPALLLVAGAAKFEDVADGWVLTDGTNVYTNPAVEIDNMSGFVKMIGGHFTGAGTVGLNGSVLLGWIDFQAKDGVTGSSDLTVSLAYDNPSYLHFVKADGSPDEPQNIPAVLSTIYVGADACEGDITGSAGVADNVVNFLDLGLMKSKFFDNCGDLPAGQVCTADLNGDGSVNFLDLGLMKEDFFRSDCP